MLSIQDGQTYRDQVGVCQYAQSGRFDSPSRVAPQEFSCPGSNAGTVFLWALAGFLFIAPIFMRILCIVFLCYFMKNNSYYIRGGYDETQQNNQAMVTENRDQTADHQLPTIN